MENKTTNKEIDASLEDMQGLIDTANRVYSKLISLRYCGAPEEFNASMTVLGTPLAKQDWLRLVYKQRLDALQQYSGQLEVVPEVIRYEIVELTLKLKESKFE